MNLKEKITAIAKAKGETRASVERAAGIANGSIADWEKSSPRVRSLQAVAKVLGVSIMDLIEEEEDGTAVQ